MPAETVVQSSPKSIAISFFFLSREWEGVAFLLSCIGKSRAKKG